jgi:predicted kinase
MSDILDNILQGASPSIDQIVRDLGDRLPLLHELEATPQDPEWHAEGNVLIHTGMVLNEAYELLATELRDISPERRAALILGAALHDIAKPLTTREREIDGRVRVVSPRHEPRGRSYIALQLAGALPYSVLDQAMAMTGYHNAPKLLVVRNKSAGDYRRLSRLVDMELVYWLEVADMRGRECIDKEEQLEHLEMFRLFASEYDCWQSSHENPWTPEIREALSTYPAATLDLVMASALNDHEEGKISTPEEAIARSYSYRDEYPELVVTVGLSGSGKTTWIGKQLGDHQVISLDEIRSSLSRREDQQNNSKVLRMAREELREHLRAKKRVVWDATSLRTDFRRAIVDLAKDYRALVTIVAFHCSQEELARRNKTRPNPVPSAARLKQLTSTQWPEISEAHRFLDVDGHGRLLAAHGCPGGLPYDLEGPDDD